MLAAVLALVSLTLLFVVNINAPADPDRDHYSFVIGTQGRLSECDCKPLLTASQCLRGLGDRQAILAC